MSRPHSLEVYSQAHTKVHWEDSAASEWDILTDTPGSRSFIEEGLVRFENTNLLIRVKSLQAEFSAHRGPLSVLFAVNGREALEIDGSRSVIDDTSYLIMNLGQQIGSSIQSDTAVECFTVGFWPGFAEEVLRSLVTPADQLLDSPRSSCSQAVHFFDQTYPHDSLVSPVLFRLRAAIGQNWVTQDWLEEQNHLLLEQLLHVHRNIGRQLETLPAVRASTRAELYRRLHHACDFMDACLHQPISLQQIAQAAWMSPHHFLRLFKQVYQETPHQYLTRRRLEKAQSLLMKTELPVTEICFAVGFQSLGSFSWLFHRRLGKSPEQFRRHCSK